MATLAGTLGLLFGVLLLFLPLSKLALALLAIVGMTLVMRRPLLGLELFAFVAALLPYSTVQLGIRITICEALLGLTWLGVGWRMITGEIRLHLGQTERAVLRLVAFSALPFVVGQLMVHAEGNGVVTWLRWILNIATLALVPALLDTREKRERIVWLILAGSGVMLVFSVALFLKDHDAQTMIPYLVKAQYGHPEALQDIFSANYTRMASPWVHPNLTGGALALILPLALLFTFSRRGLVKYLTLAVVLLGAAGLMFSISRGAIVSLALVLLWLLYWRVPHIGRILVIGTVLSAALIVFYPPLQERLSTMFSAQNASTEVRMDEYRKFPEAIAQYPLGIGFKVEPPVPNTNLLGISNLWLYYMYKMSVVGMLLFIVVTIHWWRETRPRLIQQAVRRENALWIGATAAVLAALGTGVFDHYFSFTTVLIALFWLILGISLAEARLLRDDGDPAFHRPTPDWRPDTYEA